MIRLVFICLSFAYAFVTYYFQMVEGTSTNNETYMKDPVMGIDLGTTFSCVYVMKNGIAEAVPNELGHRITPSYVAYTECERHVGSEAKNRIAMNPTNTIYDIKRLIGLSYDDPMIQADLKSYPFTIEKSDDNKPLICVQSRGKTEKFSPEEISAVILEKLKTMAETYLGVQMKKAVITVPARFNSDQREATKIAGELAGLDVIFIFNEPTAAALAYGISEEDESVYKTVLVFDLGGGTLDVTILSLGGKLMKVLSTEGDSHLGGEDIDNNLMEYCLIDIRKSITDQSVLETDKRSMQRLRSACEIAKCELLDSSEAEIAINSLNDHVFKKTLTIVNLAMFRAKTKKTDIDNVFLVGGSTRILKIQELLVEEFGSSKISKSVHADEVVALGALHEAMHINQTKTGKINELVFYDVTGLPLGIRVKDDRMSVIIDQNTSIPCVYPKKYTTSYDYQTTVSIDVYEGTSEKKSDNYFLGEFELTGLPSQGLPQINVNFELTEEGILNVTASDVTESQDQEDQKDTATISIMLKTGKTLQSQR